MKHKWIKRGIIISIILSIVIFWAVFTNAFYEKHIGQKTPTNTDKNISQEEAKQIAIKESNAHKIPKIQFKKEDGKEIYKIKTYNYNGENNITLDAKTGEILKEEKTYIEKEEQKKENVNTKNTEIKKQNVQQKNPPKMLTRSEALDIALKYVPNSKLKKLEFDDDDMDDAAKYEILLEKNKIEYEMSIDAKTGKIIKYKEDDD